MDYQAYEDYMRSVLGYQNNNIYANTYPRNDYYDMPQLNTNYNTEVLNEFYPEIYRIVYPMVCKVCNQNANREFTKDLIDRMTEEIYSNIEQEDRPAVQQVRTTLKNGDVRNPNVKEPETRQGNFLLRDLIRILILRELLRSNRPPNRPPMLPPMPPTRPGNPPWRPPY